MKVVNIPLFETKISAGFPSPADDFVDTKLDLNDHLVHHPAATFFLRVGGDSMIGAGIFDGDLLIVDRSIEKFNKAVIIAVLNGEMMVKRIIFRGKSVILAPENPEYKSVEVTEDMDFSVWGVVTAVIHKML
ncbi:peptidase S24 [Candidatus Roizmanbacteria bacterium CG11_big_fil_rev_8_21_14_0_20_36_8]|uniref:Peptidase S24 n=2 Tax=Candidatus Roizmaniibacteriota TaxID=1752723 RepID=A0A2M6IUR3_9BACT|nr:MAG: peptidase S24 [Candidatus Roizmanbacteria bacterium CG11_big_fil_rev_8_21_14_0_20_36_8]PIZ64743.1 MAG: peptidase S24 [Candidatus Roizmanbacteria bacterium CG_4_10_14_0_2_um_filter_36_9]